MNNIYEPITYKKFAAILAACGIAATFIMPACAEDASGWSQDSKSAMRLIAATNKNDKLLTAGVEIMLQPGWHTYWRYPGDSGVPPRFDFSGSSNLKSAKVLFPAPQLHEDEGGKSLGYENDVIFPMEVTPATPGKPVKLDVKISYAICEKVCIPAEGHAQLSLGIGDSAQDAAMKAAEARVPRPVSAAYLGLTVHRVSNGPKPLIAVDLRAPVNETVQLFAEGPTPEWALPIPKIKQDAPAGHKQFDFELDGLPPGTDPKGQFDLTFTVLKGDRAFEVRTHLD